MGSSWHSIWRTLVPAGLLGVLVGLVQPFPATHSVDLATKRLQKLSRRNETLEKRKADPEPRVPACGPSSFGKSTLRRACRGSPPRSLLPKTPKRECFSILDLFRRSLRRTPFLDHLGCDWQKYVQNSSFTHLYIYIYIYIWDLHDILSEELWGHFLPHTLWTLQHWYVIQLQHRK